MSARDTDLCLKKPEPVLLTLMSRIQDASSRLAKACNDADEIGDRVFGAIPMVTCGMADLAPGQDGMMSALHAATDALHERISFLDNAMQRLRQL